MSQRAAIIGERTQCPKAVAKVELRKLRTSCQVNYDGDRVDKLARGDGLVTNVQWLRTQGKVLTPTVNEWIMAVDGSPAVTAADVMNASASAMAGRPPSPTKSPKGRAVSPHR
jgi:hypothetical protein